MLVLNGFTTMVGDESGAINVDWVALTAGILLVGIMVVFAISNNGVSELVGEVNDTLQNNTLMTADIGTAENQNQ